MTINKPVPIIQQDLDIIQQIENEIGKPLPELGPEYFLKDGLSPKWGTGYLPGNNGRIIGVSICNIKIPALRVLAHLDGLQQLILASIKLQDISFADFFEELKGLRVLTASYNELTDVSFLQDMKGLSELYLSRNRLTDVSFLRDMKGLTKLDISYNLIKDFSFLLDLNQLTFLNMVNSLITNVSCLRGLKGLTALYLSECRFANLYHNMEFNRFFDNLINVQHRLSDISYLREFKNLSKLGLSKLNLRDASFLSNLRELRELDLSNNLISDISFLKDMDNLQYVNLDGNPLDQPPQEIISQGIESIRNYFNALAVEKKQLQEVKVLLVGDGGSGKTSLLKQLQKKKFNPNEPQTHGINIQNLPSSIAKQARVHLWDFGGQDIMHATHQFFLSERSLYILVTDSRKNDNVEHWLKHIRSFGGDSPVMIVINKIDQTPSFDLNRRDLLNKFPNIRNFYKISCANRQGLDEFTHDLMKKIQEAEYMSTLWPLSWFDVKTALEKTKKNYINLDHYCQICQEKHVTDPSEQKTLLEFLHNLGVVLHFEKLDLKDYQVLEPHWVTEAVYKIINSQLLANSRGYLKKDLLGHILHHETFDRNEYQVSLKTKKYSPQEQQYLVCLMKTFELCYSLDDDETLLVPDLLKAEMPPEYQSFDPAQCLCFIYRFDFLPPSVIPRFIVKMHQFILSPGLQWRSGVILENRKLQTHAMVIADKEAKQIQIHVNGSPTDRRDFMTFIRQTLETIFSSFKKLMITEWIPLPDKHPNDNQNILVEYENLLGHLNDNHPYYDGRLRKTYDIYELLNGIEKKTTLLENLPGKDYPRYEFNPTIELKPEIKVTCEANAQAQAHSLVNLQLVINQVASLQEICAEIIPLLKETLRDSIPQLKDVDQAIGEIEKDHSPKEMKNRLSKLGYFLKKLGDKDSDQAKILQGFGKALNGAKKVARVYNNLAGLLPITLPKVPDFLLKE